MAIVIKQKDKIKIKNKIIQKKLGYSRKYISNCFKENKDVFINGCKVKISDHLSKGALNKKTFKKIKKMLEKNLKEGDPVLERIRHDDNIPIEELYFLLLNIKKELNFE